MKRTTWSAVLFLLFGFSISCLAAEFDYDERHYSSHAPRGPIQTSFDSVRAGTIQVVFNLAESEKKFGNIVAATDSVIACTEALNLGARIPVFTFLLPAAIENLDAPQFQLSLVGAGRSSVLRFSVYKHTLAPLFERMAAINEAARNVLSSRIPSAEFELIKRDRSPEAWTQYDLKIRYPKNSDPTESQKAAILRMIMDKSATNLLSALNKIADNANPVRPPAVVRAK